MSARSKFVLLMLVFAFPFVGSTISYFYYQPAKKINYGELLSPPVTLSPTILKPIVESDLSAIDLRQSLRGKWLLLTIDGGVCDNRCRQKLYLMKQSRTILGKNQDRVVRVVLVDDEATPSAAVIHDYAGTLWIRARESAWQTKLPKIGSGTGDARVFIYAVDPLGNAFIRYPADADIKKVVRDLERVLKISQIG